ncbi:unnamed protein product [Orchesella dallaii]|uniref:C2H2-type domain-containing protein n=1 Tax=Orchesella dallaii TaxID=48710 RepID=A0ABP1RJS1_9HEXA
MLPPPDIPTQPYESEQLQLMGVSLLRSARRLVKCMSFKKINKKGKENGNEKLAWRCIYCGVHISERSITPLLPPFIRHKIPADVRSKVRTIMKHREQNQEKLQGAIRQKQHDGRYHCGMCEKTFKTSYGRTKHLKIHEESRACAACKKEFTTAESLRRHQKRKSCKAMEKYIPCQHCGKEFPRANG